MQVTVKKDSEVDSASMRQQYTAIYDQLPGLAADDWIVSEHADVAAARRATVAIRIWAKAHGYRVSIRTQYAFGGGATLFVRKVV